MRRVVCFVIAAIAFIALVNWLVFTLFIFIDDIKRGLFYVHDDWFMLEFNLVLLPSLIFLGIGLSCLRYAIRRRV
jgi:hypothetical protein